jgi:hypothetical protein
MSTGGTVLQNWASEEDFMMVNHVALACSGSGVAILGVQ